MKKGLVVLVILGAFGLLFPLHARAVCNVAGEVVRLFDTAASTTAYIRPSSLATFVYSTTVVDSDLREAVRSCENSRHRCSVLGNIAACPVVGAIRNIGVPLSVTTNP